MSRKVLQIVWMVSGVIALIAGTVTLVTGGDLIAGAGTVSPSLDSELRFYAAWYAAVGVLLIRTAPQIESYTTMVRAVCAVLFVAACARLLSVITVGTPHTLALVLMTIEFIYPCVMVPWQTAVARRVGTEPT